MFDRSRNRIGAALFAAVGLALLSAACTGGRARVGVIAPDGSSEFTLMDFSAPLDLDALPEGWSHRTFLRHDPMDISFIEKDGRAAIRLATDDTASMLFRLRSNLRVGGSSPSRRAIFHC